MNGGLATTEQEQVFTAELANRNGIKRTEANKVLSAQQAEPMQQAQQVGSPMGAVQSDGLTGLPSLEEAVEIARIADEPGAVELLIDAANSGDPLTIEKAIVQVMPLMEAVKQQAQQVGSPMGASNEMNNGLNEVRNA